VLEAPGSLNTNALALLPHYEILWARLLAVHAEQEHICAMPGAKVTCTCGAIYEVIETKGPSRGCATF
jgi:hypothetical protein